MLQTWKKEVWDGSSPVLPGGTTTSIGATKPTRAGAPTCIIIRMRYKLDSFGELTTHFTSPNKTTSYIAIYQSILKRNIYINYIQQVLNKQHFDENLWPQSLALTQTKWHFNHPRINNPSKDNHQKIAF